jgi:hypothetical protein
MEFQANWTSNFAFTPLIGKIYLDYLIIDGPKSGKKPQFDS